MPFAPNIWLLIVVLCAYGVASAFLGTAPAAAVGDATGGAARALRSRLFSMCADLGAIVGPLVAGLLADAVSYPAAFGVGAAADDRRRRAVGRGCRREAARRPEKEPK